jgi:hypothetical protein
MCQIINLRNAKPRRYADAARDQGIYQPSLFADVVGELVSALVRDIFRACPGAVHDVLGAMTVEIATPALQAEYFRSGAGLEVLCKELRASRRHDLAAFIDPAAYGLAGKDTALPVGHAGRAEPSEKGGSGFSPTFLARHTHPLG